MVNTAHTLHAVKSSLLRWPVIAAMAIVALVALIVAVHVWSWVSGATA